MLTDNEFHTYANAILDEFERLLDDADASGALDMEHGGDQLSIIYPNGKTTLISKHGVTRELWLASPVQGGLHFVWKDGNWELADGTQLKAALIKDLKLIGGVEL